MERRRLGELELSVVGIGCNNFGGRIDAAATKRVVDAAIDAGINYFDTAEIYGAGKSEEFLGAALGTRRGDVLVATKWGVPSDGTSHPAGGAEIRRAVEASLRRLGTDYIDHYQLHRHDPTTPASETLGVLAELRSEGKVREIGCSNFSDVQLAEAAAEAAALGLPPYRSVQNHYSLLAREPETDGVLDACARTDTMFVPYFPLESGVLTGKYRAGAPLPEGSRLAGMPERASQFIDDDRLRIVAALTEWAESHGHSLLDLAVGWLVSNPLVASVICGATKPEQVAANAAAGAWHLDADELAGVAQVLASAT